MQSSLDSFYKFASKLTPLIHLNGDDCYYAARNACTCTPKKQHQKKKITTTTCSSYCSTEENNNGNENVKCNVRTLEEDEKSVLILPPKISTA